MCVADPASQALELTDDGLTVDTRVVSGDCATASPTNVVASGRTVRFDDPNQSNDVATYDWLTMISALDHATPAGAQDFADGVQEGAQEGSLCTLSGENFWGFEARTVVTSELDGITYRTLALTTSFVQGQYTVTFKTSVRIDADAEEIARRLVPVRNVPEADLNEIIQGL